MVNKENSVQIVVGSENIQVANYHFHQIDVILEKIAGSDEQNYAKKIIGEQLAGLDRELGKIEAKIVSIIFFSIIIATTVTNRYILYIFTSAYHYETVLILLSPSILLLLGLLRKKHIEVSMRKRVCLGLLESIYRADMMKLLKAKQG